MGFVEAIFQLVIMSMIEHPKEAFPVQERIDGYIRRSKSGKIYMIIFLDEDKLRRLIIEK